MGIREFVYGAVKSDLTIQSLGLSADTIFSVGAPDAPASPQFAVLRFGGATDGVRGTRRSGRRYRQLECALWVYDKQLDYSRVINPALNAFENLVDRFSGDNMGDNESMFEPEYNGQDDDGWDDVYERIVRSSRFTLTYSTPGGTFSD